MAGSQHLVRPLAKESCRGRPTAAQSRVLRPSLGRRAVLLALALGASRVFVFGSPVGAADLPANLLPGGPFALLDGTGKPVTEQSFRGKWQLIFFGYTFCPDFCPTTLGAVAEALEALGPLAEKVQPIFISIDPERDNPQVVAAYVGNFDKRIVGLTGSAEAVAGAAKAFKVHYERVATGEGPGDYAMDHSGFLYLMRPDGSFSQLLAGTLSGGQLASKLRPLLEAS